MMDCPDCGAEMPASGTCAACTTAAASAQAVQAPPGAPFIEGYTILQLLGEGGMGSVYLAQELALNRKVATKIMRTAYPQKALTERFAREARTMATIEDANVVRLYSFGATSEFRYLVMEYVGGESLAAVIKRRGALPLDEVCRIGVQACYGLRSAAAKGIVHRDVKPANILIDERQTVRVADFGLAKQTFRADGIDDEALTTEGTFVGTPNYIPPEQAEGAEPTSAGDVYSLGLVLYELLTASRPFTGDSPLAVIAKHLHEPLPDPRRKVRGIPRQMVRLLREMTSKKPAERPAFDQVIATLENISLWYHHKSTQIGIRHVFIVLAYALGFGTAVTLAFDVAPYVGALKAIALTVAAAVGGAASVLILSPSRVVRNR